MREWPPGFGGIERVAHELGCYWEEPIFSLDAKSAFRNHVDPLNVPYERVRIPRLLIGRVVLPLPSRGFVRLIFSREPLHAHLPCPGVMLLVFLIRLLRPRREISLHWHAFISSDVSLEGFLIAIYQFFALLLAANVARVFTTSPVLVSELIRWGCDPSRVIMLPCCLDAKFEEEALALPIRSSAFGNPLKVLFIGRLDSYKRLDWLLSSLKKLDSPWSLDVVGDGGNRSSLQELAIGQPVRFWGRLSESEKLKRLGAANLLVLPSDRCNEAFGIVQLEAMASGIPSLAFDLPRSGMAWVSRLPGLCWSHNPDELADVLQQIAIDPEKLALLCHQARGRYCNLFSREVWLERLKKIS